MFIFPSLKVSSTSQGWRNKYLSVFRDYVHSNCDEKLRQKSNLSAKENRGIKKLKKRVSEGEIMICLTDKSGRFTALPMEMYHEAAKVHIDKDKEITFTEAEDIQDELNGHCALWLKMTQMAQNWDHKTRQRKTHIDHSVSIAPVYFMVKDHRKWNGTDPIPTCPVCSAVAGMNVHLSNIISPYLDAIADEMKGTMEIISTEDGLARIDLFNKQQDESSEQYTVPPDDGGGGKYTFQDSFSTDEKEFLNEEEILESQNDAFRQHDDITIQGSDVNSLFPSLDALYTSKLVNQAAIESEIKFDGLDFKEIVTYLAINLSEWQARKVNIWKLLPKRKSRFGQKPTITGDSAKAKTSTHDVHWNYPKLDFSDQDKKILFAKALEVGTFKLFSLHVYQFGSRIFKQRKGGLTGVRGTMAASRVVMGIYDRRLAEVMEREKLEVRMRMRYVDDIQILMKPIKEGWRWENNKLRFRKCWQLKCQRVERRNIQREEDIQRNEEINGQHFQ